MTKNSKVILLYIADKEFPDEYKTKAFYFWWKSSFRYNRFHTVGDILNFGASFSGVMKSFLLYLDDEGVGDFIEKIDEYVEDPQKLHHDFPDFFDDAEVRKLELERPSLLSENEFDI